MKTVSFPEARNNLKSVLDMAVNDATVTVMAQRDAKPVVSYAARLLQWPNGNDVPTALAG